MGIVSLRGVAKEYAVKNGAPFTALRDVDLDIAEHDYLVITGRSGCGKTTLLTIAAGLARPTAGSVTVDGVDLWSLSDTEQSKLRNGRMGFVFQFPSLLPSLTVLQNVTLPLEFGGEHAADFGARARELLGLVGLGEKLTAYPRELSAGQQQRVVVARALVNRPALLLADEPTSDLDEETEAEMMALFRRIHDERDITIVMVTHTRQLISYGTRHVEMATGSIVTGVAVADAKGVAETGDSPSG
jgi:ABC-type lipoprotein export system ATPase subunit